MDMAPYAKILDVSLMSARNDFLLDHDTNVRLGLRIAVFTEVNFPMNKSTF